MALLRNNYFRFGATLILAALYSLLRTTDLSILVKPLPVILWLLIMLASPTHRGGNWVIASLVLAFIGDILLDIGDKWLAIGVVPFLCSTVLLAIAFHIKNSKHWLRVSLKEILLLGFIIFQAVVLFGMMTPHLGEYAKIGAVLLALSVSLLWRSLSAALWNSSETTNYIQWIGFFGACGIVANYVLYAINLGPFSVPRDLVIQLYYWGQAFATWSFLKR